MSGRRVEKGVIGRRAMASLVTNSEGKYGKGLLRKPIDFMASFVRSASFVGSAPVSLFFIADEELQAATVKKTGEDGRAGLAALLGLIIDSYATTGEKGLKCGVLPTEVP